MRLISSFMAFLVAFSAGSVAAQDASVGKPTNAGVNFQAAATELARDIHWLDHMILVIIAGIVVFVCILLVYVIARFNRRSNPTPASFTHNTPLEIGWTLVPIVILVFIGAFSLPVLFKQQEIPEGDINIKVTGNQWYWSYEYVDDGFGFDSFLVDASYKINDPEHGWGDDQPMGPPQVRSDVAIKKLEYFGYSADEFLLGTDTAVVVPVGKVVVMNVTGSDVIHSWAMPAFGVKQDAVPGRLAQLWFTVEKEGTYFGQCSELCGKDHAFMPITVKAVSQAEYDKWLAATKEEYASVPQSRMIASAE